MARFSVLARAQAVSLSAALLLTVAACSDTSSSAAGEKSPAAVQTDSVARDLLSEETKNSGVLNIATSLNWAPFAYKGENGQAKGLDIELTTALAQKLGLKPETTDVAFTSMIAGVSNHRYDIAVNELQDTPERRKEVQFVHYYRGAMGLLMKKGGSGVSVDDLCGHAIGITQGSSAVAVVEEKSAECQTNGKAKIEQKIFPDSASTILAVQNGRAEGLIMNYASGKYLTETTAGDLALQDGFIPGSERNVGVVVAKDRDDLANAIKAALQSLINDGWYADLLNRYGVPHNAVKEPTLSTEE